MFDRVSHIICLYFIVCMPLLGQNATIGGVVKGNEGEIAFASINISDGNKSSYSDEKGLFVFNGLDSGCYILVVSYVGYKAEEIEVCLKNDELRNLEVILEMDNVLEEVVVTGTMKATYVSESPIKVEVLNSKTLEKFMPSSSSGIMDGVRMVNGVEEVVACGVCFTNSISIHGLPGPYTAVLMDGSPMYGNLAAVYGLNGIPNMIIDRFEVIKGPSSTLYGSEAVAGVINVITKDPAEQPAVELDLMTSTLGENFLNLASAPKIGKSAGYIGVNYGVGSKYFDQNMDGFGDFPQFDRISIFTKWDLARPSQKTFSIAAKYYREDRNNGVEDFMRDNAYKSLRGSDEIYGESIQTDRIELFGSYGFVGESQTRLDYSFSLHRQNSYYGSDFYEAEQEIAYTNLTRRFELGKHEILGGLTLRWQSYDDNTTATSIQGPDGITNQPDDQFIPGIFLQDEWKPGKKMTVLAGLRVDHYSEHGFIPAPRLSVKLKPSDWSTFRFNFGTGFRVVNLFTEDHAFISGQREVVITEDLKPERSRNLSFNYNQVYTLGQGSGTLDAELYFTNFTNKILPDYSEQGKIIYSNSDGSSRTLGLGVSFNHSFMFPLEIGAGITVQKATIEEEDENGDLVERDIEFAPSFSGLLTATYLFKKAGIQFALSSNIKGPMALPEVYDLDSEGNPLMDPRPLTSATFGIINLQISKTLFKGIELYGGIQNIGNQIQNESPLAGTNDPDYGPGFSPYFDTSYAYGPLRGRAYYLGFKWKLGER